MEKLLCETIADKGLLYKNDKTLNMLKIDEEEHPVVVQIFGSSVETLTQAAIYVEANTNADIIDINMGCPVPKVAVRAQAGSALLKDPNKVYEIVIKGHAGYDIAGKDIVCASVSSVAICSVNATIPSSYGRKESI